MKNTIKEIISYILIILLVIFIKKYVFTFVTVQGTSMHPTLHNKDKMILNELKYKYSKVKRFDIVVIDMRTSLIVKRVIALPGETIEYKDNLLYINGEQVDDPYNNIEMDDFKVKLDVNEYFVMGDNRGSSMDSRRLGAFYEKDILGKANLVIFPFSNIGFK